MTFKQRLFSSMLRENLLGIFSLRGLAIPLGVFMSISIAHPGSAIKVIWALITSPLAWLVYFLLFIADAFIRAAYWYARERNPSYIKKQEAYERWKAEKAAKQASPDLPGKSGETSADQVR